MFLAPLYQSIVLRSDCRAWNLTYESFSWRRRLKTSFSETSPPLPLKRYGLRKLSPNLNNFVKSPIVFGFRHLECINLSRNVFTFVKSITSLFARLGLHSSCNIWERYKSYEISIASYSFILYYLFYSFSKSKWNYDCFREEISKYHCVH